jgi:hypothetical protein
VSDELGGQIRAHQVGQRPLVGGPGRGADHALRQVAWRIPACPPSLVEAPRLSVDEADVAAEPLDVVGHGVVGPAPDRRREIKRGGMLLVGGGQVLGEVSDEVDAHRGGV